MLNLYTLAVEYRGGSYVSQIKARSPKDALLQLATARSSPKRGELGSRIRLEIKKQLENENGPVALKGCKNVWCQSGIFNDELVLVHVICTCA